MESKSEPSRKSEQLGEGTDRSWSGLYKVSGRRDLESNLKSCKCVQAGEPQLYLAQEREEIFHLKCLSLLCLFRKKRNFQANPSGLPVPEFSTLRAGRETLWQGGFHDGTSGGCTCLCLEPFSPVYPVGLSPPLHLNLDVASPGALPGSEPASCAHHVEVP